MEERGKTYSLVNHALRNDISALWDDCFGDLPLAKQRLLKAFGMMNPNRVYVHHSRYPITIETMRKEGPLNIYQGESYFAPDSPQVKVAQETIDDILKDFMKGKSRAARYLRYFMKDKKVTVGVYKSLKNDAGMDGYNPLTKEIYLEFNAGCFSPEVNGCACLDILACTVGHEIGHAIEQLHRSARCDSNYVGVSSNGWEIELFCDTLGLALSAERGYCLQKEIDARLKMAEKYDDMYSDDNPHPPMGYRAEYAALVQNVYEAEKKSAHEFSSKVKNTEWNAQRVSVDVSKSIINRDERG